MKVLHCSLLLLLFLTEAKPRHPASTPPSARNHSVPASGRLTTAEGHRCVWQTSGDVVVNLQVNCSTDTPGQHRYWCHYAGKPHLCQVYVVKSSQYWKQLVSKLKKRPNACEGEKVLKAQTCKKAPAEAHMKLVQRSGDVQRTKGKTRMRTDVMNDMQQQESYCSDKWKSICSFFLVFFEGNEMSQFEV
ncbi:fibroblast growth factor-binding protein 1 [Solea solea]|uniref:fibroblast growth factor-binding protein 1 n=1 Tax=Solea solea TaxID=90069 RepID=UPI00272C2B25|nr:fibroblast growth factor-binding protein 1 [Solea solea]